MYSFGQVEARYLLTPAFMERLMAFADLYRGKVTAGFRDSQLHLAIDDGEDRYELAGGTLTDPQRVAEIARGISLLCDVVAELKLNAGTRI